MERHVLYRHAQAEGCVWWGLDPFPGKGLEILRVSREH